MPSDWSDSMFCGFDLETTGPNPLADKVVTASLVMVNAMTSPPKVAATEWLANPGVDIPEGATAVHGVTTEYAATYGQPHDQVCHEVATRLRRAWSVGATVVAYNATFDLTIISRFAELPVEGLVLDPLVIDREFDKYRRGSRKLVDVCAHYGIPLTEEEAHTSKADSLAATRLAWKLLRVFPALTLMSARDLMEHQLKWHTEQQQSLAEHFTKQGKTFDTVGPWPIASK